MTTEKSPKNPSFFCENCNFITDNKKDYRRHLGTSKHARLSENNDYTTELPKKTQKYNKFTCLCGKEYNDRAGLWRHKKICQEIEKKEEIKNDNEVVLLLLKENLEFKQMMMEQNKQNIELQKQLLDLAKETKITTINNNTNNNKFNMNIFLNEKCKDALNIMDFVNSLQLQLQDLEKTSELGYVNGISRIFINGLKQLDVYKRPIHCSDSKRETLYVKDNDTWEKEDTDKKKITRAIRHVSIRNAKQVSEWTKENKSYSDSTSKKNDKYLKIVSEANGGEPEELNKIIKNISTIVVINKDEL